MALDMAAYDAALMKYYSRRFEDMIFGRRPLLGMIPKNTGVGGSDYSVSLRTAPTGGRSASYEAIAASKAASVSERFTSDLVSNYSVADVKGKVIRASRKDSHALMGALSNEMEMAGRSISNDIAMNLFRNQDGVRGTQAGAISTRTVTLTNKYDARNFERGMLIDVASTATGTLDTNGPHRVSQVNRRDGTVTFGGSTTVTALADGVVFFAHGDAYAFAGGPGADTYKKLAGLGDWLNPSIATDGTDAFMTVDRGDDVTRLGPTVYTQGSSESIFDLFVNAAAELDMNGGSTADTIVTSPINVAALDRALDGKASYERMPARGFDGKAIGTVGYEALRIHTPNGVMKVVGDGWCPVTHSYILDLSSWELASYGEAPALLKEDGQSILRLAGDDAYEFRIGGDMQLFCSAPGDNAVIVHYG